MKKNVYLFDELPVDVQEKALKRIFASPYYEGMMESGVDDACQELIEKLCPNSGHLIDWDFDFLWRCGEPSNHVVVKEFSLRADSPERVAELLKDIFVEYYRLSLPENIFNSVVLFASFDDPIRIDVNSSASYNLVSFAAEGMRRWFYGVYVELQETIKTTIESYHSLDYVRDHIICAGIKFDFDGCDIGGRMERD